MARSVKDIQDEITENTKKVEEFKTTLAEAAKEKRKLENKNNELRGQLIDALMAEKQPRK